MRTVGVLLSSPADFAGWRDQARRLLLAEVPPEAVEWRAPGEAPSLFAAGAAPDVSEARAEVETTAIATPPPGAAPHLSEGRAGVETTGIATPHPGAVPHLSEGRTAGETPPATPPGAALEASRPAPAAAAPCLSEEHAASETPAAIARDATSEADRSARAGADAAVCLSEGGTTRRTPAAIAPGAASEADGSWQASPRDSVLLSEGRSAGETPPASPRAATAYLSEPRAAGETPPGTAAAAVDNRASPATLRAATAHLSERRAAGETPPATAAAAVDNRASPATPRAATAHLSKRRAAGETPDAPTPEPAAGAGHPAPTVPRAFVDLSERAIRHRDPERFALLYRVLWRLTHGEPALMRVATDPDIACLAAMEKSVRRDAHKMHAFVRFREIRTEDGPRYVAWFEPEHHILEAEAGFFVRRFAAMRWSILTPSASAHWDGASLAMGPGARRADAPAEDAQEDLWRAYYGSIFNSARLKPAAMRAEMPVKYWRNLPEAREIPRLIAEAPRRAAAMVERGPSAPALRRQRNVHAPAQPAAASDVTEPMPAADLFTATADPAEALAALRAEMLALNSLPPWTADATQMVFGEGPVGAPLLFVGEQPGDEEDIAGRPFVGPAGRLFNKCLEEAGIGRSETYVTNAVKHFKFKPTGRRRLHQSPDAGDIAYYRPFLRREIDLVGPQLVVTLGASALRAMSGKPLAIGKTRGEVMPMADGPPIFPTVHPSYLLRLPDPDSKAREYERFVADLKRAHREVA